MKTPEVEVVDIRMITGDGNLKAFADIRVGDALVIKAFLVMQGKSGIFVACPRKASKDGRWFDILEMEDDLRKAVENKILDAYKREKGPELVMYQVTWTEHHLTTVSAYDEDQAERKARELSGPDTRTRTISVKVKAKSEK